MPDTDRSSLTLTCLRLCAVAAVLRRRGCRVRAAAALPAPRLRIDPPPPGAIDTHARRALPAGAVAPIEHVAEILGTTVTWYATPGA